MKLSKKVVLVGPQEVGKSTLRKWIFEGESVIKLLENPLEATFGVENYSYNLLLNNIGVFDLAGQENDRWFEENVDIFNESDLILNVLDARFAPKILSDKIDLALKVEKQQAPKSLLFFLIHKIDLIDSKQIEKIKKALKDKNVEIFYTSIKLEYLHSTIECFIEIFKKSGFEWGSKIDFDLVKLNTQLFHFLLEKKVMSLKKLEKHLDIDKSTLESLINPYAEAELLNKQKVEEETLVYLLEKGEIFYKKILKTFEVDSKTQTALITDEDSIASYLYGLIISDMHGKTLISIETEPDSLYKALNAADNDQFDIELIGMFLNALQKFSQEINVQNLSSFRVQGANLKISSISKRNLTLTLFTSPKMDAGDLKEEFDNLFNLFLSKYEDFLPAFHKTGNVSPFIDWIPEAEGILKKIIIKYKETKGNAKIFDVEKAKNMYAFLNKVDEKKFKLEKQLQFRNLKVKLLETIISEDGSKFMEMESEITEYLTE
nr:hypothetical protein DSAG12_01734 [Candidatus Prometheoarchaeum syntrophicum]